MSGETEERPRCANCGCETDPDCCWCGTGLSFHQREEHSFVPMGCECHFDRGALSRCECGAVFGEMHDCDAPVDMSSPEMMGVEPERDDDAGTT